MSFPPSGPGKTAPKLHQDFLVFDPARTGSKGNVLADSSPPVGEGVQLAPTIGSCKHDYATKLSQSITPPLDLRPDGTTHYKLATVCKKCRVHADIKINYARSTNPCPNSEYPLHHFQRLHSEDTSSQQRLTYAWQCSAPQCQASLHVSYRPARIQQQQKDLLTNTELLKRRYEAVVEQDPAREGIRQATPIDALTRLRKYIKDSLRPEHDRRTFPANNKRFMEAFGIHGEDCRELLQRLGFQYAEQELAWTLPDPPQVEDRWQADGSSEREMLEDVELELLAWSYKIASETGAINPAVAEGWPSANRDAERTLAAQGYPRHVSMRRGTAANEELGYLNSLGALPDFADSLIAFAYDRQSNCDPEHEAYYLECLQVITESRGTEQLHMKIATLQSQDLVSRRDITAAYRYLNIDLAQAKGLSDDRVVELFQVRQQDISAVAAEEARQHLYKIGLARGSQRIINASRQSVDTYEDALAWLGNGVDKNSSDDSLLAVFAIKKGENPANEEIGRKAISTIARERQSNMLNNWLLTGGQDSYTMSLDEALRICGIEQNLDTLDPTIVPMVLESARLDKPGETTEKAIAIIQQALAGKTTTSRAPETWPVGLTSHGNTCYLNSLLQYYFSIKPFRDIILDYDKYKLDTSTHAEKQERVGQRIISMVEIKGGQRFAEDLKHLFERMIKDPGTAVKPEEDLVCRAFLDPKDYALLASSIRELAPTVNGVANAIDEKITDAPETQEPTSATVADDMHQSDASSTTLQGDDADITMKNTGELPPTPPESPGQHPQDKKPEPDHAPPLPPRRFSTTKEQALDKAKSNARQQQDVTEVHDAAMFRLRAGMLPEGMDAAGEQKDALRDLYSIDMLETPVIKGVPAKPKAILDSGIQLNVPTEPTDIYSALDAIFDLQPFEENPDHESFKSIRYLPPVLQINIPRIGFDISRPGGAYKSEECVKLEDELYLDRYCDGSHPQVLPRRRQCWGWRKQLQTLRKEQKALAETSIAGVDGPTAVSQTADYLNGLGDVNEALQDVGLDSIDLDSDVSAALKSHATQQAERVKELEIQISDLQKQLEGQFTDLNHLKYRLAAVFFHRGGHGHGHYWIYIHDFANNVWRIYNDERVEEFTKMEDIFEAKTWSQGTPTYAVYVRDDKKAEIVQPVCRAPEKPPTPEPSSWPADTNTNTQLNDVQMTGGNDKPVTHIEPKLVQEGGKQSWDDTDRQVAAGVNWSNVSSPTAFRERLDSEAGSSIGSIVISSEDELSVVLRLSEEDVVAEVKGLGLGDDAEA